MASSDNAAEEINFVIMKYAKSYLLSLTHALSLSLPNKTVQGLTTILTSNLFIAIIVFKLFQLGLWFDPSNF